MFLKGYFWAKQRTETFVLIPLRWLTKKHFSQNKNKNAGKLARLAVAFLGSGTPVSSVLLDNGEKILITVLSLLILCATTHRGDERRKTVMPVSDECSCPVLANYVLTKHFKGSTLNRSRPGCPVDAVQHSTDRCHFIMPSNFL